MLPVLAAGAHRVSRCCVSPPPRSPSSFLSRPFSAKIEALVTMGFPRSRARDYFRQHQNSTVEDALDAFVMVHHSRHVLLTAQPLPLLPPNVSPLQELLRRRPELRELGPLEASVAVSLLRDELERDLQPPP